MFLRFAARFMSATEDVSDEELALRFRAHCAEVGRRVCAGIAAWTNARARVGDDEATTAVLEREFFGGLSEDKWDLLSALANASERARAVIARVRRWRTPGAPWN